MKRYRLFLIGAMSLAFVSSAFSANTLSAGGHNGIVRSQSSDPLGTGTVQFGGALHYGQEWEYIHYVIPNQEYKSPRLVSGVGYIGIGVAPMLDLAFNLPAYYDNPRYGDVKPKGIGDLEVSLKLSGFGLKGDDMVFTGAYYFAMQFPTGNTDEGFFPRHAYYGSESNWSSENVLFLPMLVSTIHFDRAKNHVPMQLNLNFGGVFNAPARNNLLNSSVGLSYFPNDFLTFFTELSAEERFHTVNDDFFADLFKDPVYLTPGLKINIPKAYMSITLAADFGLSLCDEEYAQVSPGDDGSTVVRQANPLYNAFFGLSWMIPGTPKDKYGDGITGKDDLCPDQAEDRDGFEDTDGCPDTDNDKDGIPDANDRCPTQAGIADNAGCPDVDTDKDGLIDRLDKCPDKAGIAENSGCPDADSDNDNVVDRLDKCPDKAGVAANNGCPDTDADKDGVVDRLDKCLNETEDLDNFQDADGCPDNDNDGDGFPDLTDKCPNNPGVAETGGCPKTKEISRGQLILKGVNFESGKAVLLSGSFKVLDEIAESLREWPEVRVEVQGHTDNTGNAAKNQELSQQRAETVRQYLIQKGISSDRLTAVGYGQDRPVADNKTANGRAQNRRVELNRLD